MDRESVHRTNRSYWDTMANEVLGAITLPLYGAFVSEEQCQLFGNVIGKRLLEIGCGNGQSLQYQWEKGASELWGIDLSAQQIEKAKQHLAACGCLANLRCAPMEEDCGIPLDHFDFVYSIYAIGWTTDLEGTFRRVASYLKQDGIFIFSWSHPIHKCVASEGDALVFRKCYFDESWYTVPQDFCQGSLALADRKLSTYVNALANAGFAIEEMMEESEEELLNRSGRTDDFVKRAKMFPVTFVIKARKL